MNIVNTNVNSMDFGGFLALLRILAWFWLLREAPGLFRSRKEGRLDRPQAGLAGFRSHQSAWELEQPFSSRPPALRGGRGHPVPCSQEAGFPASRARYGVQTLFLSKEKDKEKERCLARGTQCTINLGSSGAEQERSTEGSSFGPPRQIWQAARGPEP